MSDRDFIRAVRIAPDVSDAEAFLLLVKQAGVADLAKNTVQFVKDHPQMVAGALVGAAVLAGGQYAATKPGKNGRSADQAVSDWAVKTTKNAVEEHKKSGKDPSFTKDMAYATAKGGAEVSKALSKHPGKGALLTAAPIGASMGMAVASLLKSQL